MSATYDLRSIKLHPRSGAAVGARVGAMRLNDMHSYHLTTAALDFKYKIHNREYVDRPVVKDYKTPACV